VKFLIKNFVETDPIEVSALENSGEAFVLICQRAGAMSFQHNMRPDQARFLAGALVMAAEQAEKMEVQQ
jgi:hypothetical protein